MGELELPLLELTLSLDNNFINHGCCRIAALVSHFPRLHTLKLSLMDNQYPLEQFDKVLLQVSHLSEMKCLQLSLNNISMTDDSLDLMI